MYTDELLPYTSQSLQQTISFGCQLAQTLSAGDVVALQGEMGSGKTHLAKGIAKGFGIKPQKVSSPTFSLIQEYDGRLPVYHFDCYRLQCVREAIEIGAEEYFYGTGVCLIEWPERIASILPEQTIWIGLQATGSTKRQFIMKKKGC